jgi:hypothetical protein
MHRKLSGRTGNQGQGLKTKFVHKDSFSTKNELYIHREIPDWLAGILPQKPKARDDWP